MTKISILVAIYNDEQHLPECLDSLTEQTLRDIQIICIDDCSTDKSLQIARQYADRDKRIDVIHLERNQGQAKARNAGLGIAKGELVTFLDSDDWLATDALEKAVKTFQEHPLTDTVLFRLMICTGTRRSNKGHVYDMPYFGHVGGKDALDMSLDWTIHGVYVARKNLFDKFPYDDSCHAYSDDNTTRAHYLFSREVRACDGTYFYRQNPASTTKKASPRRFMFLRANESMKDMLLKWNVGDTIIKKYENIRWLNLIDVYMFYHLHARQLSHSDRLYGIKEMRRTWQGIERSLLSHTVTRKFGYMPMPCWTMFRIQEWAYFTIRGWIGKNLE